MTSPLKTSFRVLAKVRVFIKKKRNAKCIPEYQCKTSQYSYEKNKHMSMWHETNYWFNNRHDETFSYAERSSTYGPWTGCSLTLSWKYKATGFNFDCPKNNTFSVSIGLSWKLALNLSVVLVSLELRKNAKTCFGKRWQKNKKCPVRQRSKYQVQPSKSFSNQNQHV